MQEGLSLCAYLTSSWLLFCLSWGEKTIAVRYSCTSMALVWQPPEPWQPREPLLPCAERGGVRVCVAAVATALRRALGPVFLQCWWCVTLQSGSAAGQQTSYTDIEITSPLPWFSSGPPSDPGPQPYPRIIWAAEDLGLSQEFEDLQSDCNQVLKPGETCQ